MTGRDERGYAAPYVDVGMNYVSRSFRGTDSEYDMDEDGLDIRLETGSGYNMQSCQTFLHMDVLIAMMERAGYTVTRNPPAV